MLQEARACYDLESYIWHYKSLWSLFVFCLPPCLLKRSQMSPVVSCRTPRKNPPRLGCPFQTCKYSNYINEGGEKANNVSDWSLCWSYLPCWMLARFRNWLKSNSKHMLLFFNQVKGKNEFSNTLDFIMVLINWNSVGNLRRRKMEHLQLYSWFSLFSHSYLKEISI